MWHDTKDPDELAKKREEEEKRAKSYRENHMACAHDRSAVSARSALVIVAVVFNLKAMPVSTQSFVTSVPAPTDADAFRGFQTNYPKYPSVNEEGKHNEAAENHQYAIVGRNKPGTWDKRYLFLSRLCAVCLVA